MRQIRHVSTAGNLDAARIGQAVHQYLFATAADERIVISAHQQHRLADRRQQGSQIGGMQQRGNAQVISAQVPIAEMFGYATDLRSRTQGRATYTMQFDSYQPVPESIAQEIIARVRGE